MQEIELPLHETVTTLNNQQPTIGILIESLSGSYQTGVWPGIVEVAEKNGINLICFTGGALSKSPTDPWEFQRNVLYDIAEKVDLDGILISGTLCSYVSDDEIQEFVHRFTKIPVVTLLPLSDDIPSVSVNNRKGMEELVQHLVKDHDYKSFAFVNGPEGNPEAEERLHLVTEYLSGCGIIMQETDIAPGSFTRESGAEAVSRFYDAKTGSFPYDVLICADDETAFGAIDALRNLEICVPEDIAVVGFDDESESTYITPPVTTVQQPLKELGVSALETLLELIAGKEVPHKQELNARLIIRQSCGCFEHSVKKTKIKKALIEAVSAHKELHASAMISYVTKRLMKSIEIFPFDLPQMTEMVECFCADVNTREDKRFLQSIDRIARMKIFHGSNLIKWNKFLSVLWDYSLGHLDRETFAFADALLHMGRIIRGDLVLRAQGYRRIQANREYNFIHEIGEVISNTPDKDDLLEVISAELPDLGLSTFYVVFYKQDAEPADKGLLVLSMDQGKVGLITGIQQLEFSMSELLPKDVISSHGRHTVVAEPLYFHNEQFGIIYFLVDKYDYDTNLFEVLGTYISNALHSAFLLEKVQDQADTLREQNYELEQLREKEHAYLEAIKSELELGRKIQMSFLPEEIFQPKEYSVSVAFQPAREVSGDFYDVFQLDDDRVAFIVADVSGKDVSAALFMSLVKTLLRVYGESAFKEGKSPLDAVKVVNEYVLKHHQQPRGRCMFATLFYAILTPSSGELHYVNAGHNPAQIVTTEGVVQTLAPTAPAIGLASGFEFPEASTDLNENELFFIFTDGVTEAQNEEGDFFGQERLDTILLDAVTCNADAVVDQVQTALNSFTKGCDPFDDITMMAVKRGTP